MKYLNVPGDLVGQLHLVSEAESQTLMIMLDLLLIIPYLRDKF